MTFNSEQIDKVIIWGREKELSIVADLFPGEEITENQQLAYTKYVENQQDIFAQAHEAFKKYCYENYYEDMNKEVFNIYSYIIPKSIYISRSEDENRVIGLLCKFRFDPENDLVAYIENEQVKEIGTQDIIL